MIHVNSIHDSCMWTPLFHFNNDVTFPFIWPLGNLLLPSVPTVQIDRLINEKTCNIKIKYLTRVILLGYFNFHINMIKMSIIYIMFVVIRNEMFLI